MKETSGKTALAQKQAIRFTASTIQQDKKLKFIITFVVLAGPRSIARTPFKVLTTTEPFRVRLQDVALFCLLGHFSARGRPKS